MRRGSRLLSVTAVFLVILSLTFIPAAHVTAEGVTISGRVYLPGGVEAAEVISIWLQSNHGVGTEVIIPLGENYAEYELRNVPAHSSHRLQYWLSTDGESQHLNYVASGFYSAGGTVPYSSSATNVVVGESDVEGIDITLIPGEAITGDIILPGEYVAPAEGLQVQVSNDQGFYTYVVIPAGGKSVAYSLVVPLGGSHRVAYRISPGDYPHNDFVVYAFYGAGGTTTFNQNMTYVQPGASGIDLTIIAGRSISGTISLPQGIDAPPAGLGFTVNARRSINERQQSYFGTLTPEESSVPFVLIVPAGEGYVVQYLIHFPVDGLAAGGYYSSGGVVGALEQASTLNLTTDNVDGIDIALVGGRTISGRISLPDGDAAPASGISLWVELVGGVGRHVVIPPGKSEAAFSLEAAPGQYRLQYNVTTEQSVYTRHGYFGHSGTVLNEQDAAILDVREANVTDVNLILPRATRISGTVSLPGDKTATADIQVHVRNDTGSSAWVTIPEGANAVPYSLPAAPHSSTRLVYNIGSDEAETHGYVRMGYYSVTGTVARQWNASLLSVSETGLDNINLTLIAGEAIRGLISLPDGYSAPQGGLTVQVDNSQGIHTQAVIPAHGRSAAYSLIVPLGESHMVAYHLSSWSYPQNDFVRSAFYGVAGTTTFYQQATHVQPGATDINLTIMPGRTISGTISLPEGIEVPPHGINFTVDVRRENERQQWFSGQFTSAVRSLPFVVTVPAGEGFVVEYWLHTTVGGLVRNGHYSSGGVVGSRQQADALNVTTDAVAGIDIEAVTGRTISGRISLPEGDVAPAGGLSLWVQLVDGAGTNVTIQPEGTYAAFSLSVVPGQYKLRYNINTEQAVFVRQGLYGTAGTVSQEQDAAIVDVRTVDRTDVDITLLRATTISGTVSLPDGVTATATMQVQISNNMGSHVSVFIHAGHQSATYVLPVDPSAAHVIRYRLGEGPQYVGLVRQGYYSDTGSTTTFHDQVASVAGNTSEVNLEIIPGRLMTGTVVLPQNYVVPPGGVQVHVSAGRNNEYGHSHSVTLTQAIPVAPFVLTVPQGTGYTLWYSVTAPGLAAHANYVSPTEVGPGDKAARLDVLEEHLSNLNMTLIAGKTISGVVSLPDNEYAPVGGIRFSITNNQGVWASAVIPAGYNSAHYSLVVADGEHRIQYHLQGNYPGFMGHGYYAGAQTVGDYNAAILVDTRGAGVNEVANINLVIVRAAMIRGTIRLPEGNAQSNMRFFIGTDRGAWVRVTMIAGESSVEYALAVQPNTTHVVTYRLESPSVELVQEGHYSSSGTVSTYVMASQVHVGDDGVDGIDLTLRRGTAISGAIRLPGDNVAPPGGLRVEINNGSGLSTWVTIPALSNSAVYSLVVPDRGPYRIRYWLPEWVYRGTEYVRQGYYSPTGTTVFFDQATDLDVNGPLTGIDLTLVAGYNIHGTISLPSGVAAPVGGLPLFITNHEGAWSNTMIPAGQNQTPYTLTVAPGQYRISYSITGTHSLNLLSRGYYGGGANHQQAQMVSVTAGGVSGIDMVMGTGVTVSGNIHLPPGVTLDSRLRVQVGTNDGVWTNVTIDPQQLFASYNLVVSPDVWQNVRYHISSFEYAENAFVRDGYYSASGTTSSFNDATTIRPTGNLSGIDLTLMVPQVVGTVLTPGNIAAAYGWVQVRSVTGQQVTSTGCTHDGRFTLGGLAPGDYTLRAFPNQGLSFAPSQEIAFAVSAVPAAPVELTAHLSQVQLQISASQAPHGWVEILREDSAGFQWYGGVGLNRSGNGFVGGLPDGNYRFRVLPASSGDISVSLPIGFTVANGVASPDLIEVQMQTPQLYGVLRAPNGQPVASGWVRLRDDTGRHVISVGVDQQGRFALSGLEDGLVYRVSGYADDRSGYTPSGEVEMSTATTTSTTNRMVVTLTAAQITGSVTAPGGSVPRGWVEVRDSQGRWVTSVGINRHGVYNLGGLTAGDYVVQAMAPGDANYTNGVPVAVTLAGGVLPLRVDLSMREAALTGEVNAPEGVAMSSAWVEIGDADEQWLYTVSVDGGGSFRLPDMDFSNGKTYVIKAFAPGYESELVSITAETTTIALRLEVKQ